jgi:kynurenine 3-monooxygenase
VTPDVPVTIAGAGLAGSLLAVFLARRGFEVTVYESRPDMRRTQAPAGRSINLALANRGIAALDSVGLMPQVAPLLTPMAGRTLHPVDGALGFQPYGQAEHEVVHSVSRSGLNCVLMDAAEHHGATLVFERPCTGYDFEHRKLLFTGGAEDCPVLIATDGAGSPIRHAMDEQHRIGVDEALLAHGYKELTMPAAADGSHAMEARALHIWPRGGYMLIALPNLDGSFTVTLFLPHEGGDESFAALTDEAAVADFFRTRFPDALDLIPGLPRQFMQNPTGIMGTIRTGRWHINGTVLLLGDAAHAVVPFHGQGMNCAFEDCLTLDECLEQDHDWSRVFAEVERLRKPDADAIADMALENYIEMRDLVAKPEFQLQKKLEFELERRHPGRFIRRYGLVMFHTLPYSEARRRGRIQQAILDELTIGVATLEEVDLDHADRLIEQRCDW